MGRRRELSLLDDINQYLTKLGYTCSINQVDGCDRLIVDIVFVTGNIQLMLAAEPPFYSLPEFVLINPDLYGRLAHVTSYESYGKQFGVVCVNAPDSLSINFDQPLLVLEESLKRHVALLEKCISDPDWNKKELLREFYSDWLRLCQCGSAKPLLANIEKPILQRLTVYSAVEGREYGIESHDMVHPADSSFSSLSDIHRSMVRGNRQIAGMAVVIPIKELTPAPSRIDSLEQWYIDTVAALPEETRNELQQKYSQWRDSAYWVIFTANTVGEDRTWFAIKFVRKSKKALPLTTEKLQDWKIEAIPIRLFNQENTVQRGGGKLSLSSKKVAVIGVGSVGCEVAHKLAASGVRNLTLVDPDTYSINNLYRHILDEGWVGAPKSVALCYELHRQFPWSNAKWNTIDLMKFARQENLESYDLIVIAIGNPTQERLFKQYLIDKTFEVPIINCWLEGFGIGGHAVLDVPESRGCFLCSYVCQESGARGLVSNMNFIEPNQVTMKSIAGCGEQFISYGAASSGQTGVMTANLAIRYLEGKQTESCKISWKGNDDDAIAEGIKLTHRYYNFKHSLENLSLFDEDCDVCSL